MNWVASFPNQHPTGQTAASPARTRPYAPLRRHANNASRQSACHQHSPLLRTSPPPHLLPDTAEARPLTESHPQLTCVRSSKTSLKPIPIFANRLCKSMTTFVLCSSTTAPPTFDALPPSFCERTYDCSEAICVLSEAISWRMIYVSSEISIGRSSKSVFRLATVGERSFLCG